MSHEERLWKFRKPEWMNSATARSAGVYGSGALVCARFYVLSVIRLRGVDGRDYEGEWMETGHDEVGDGDAGSLMLTSPSSIPAI